MSPGIEPQLGALDSRRANRYRLLDAVRRFGPLSRADLAKRTRLSPPTVSALVEELGGPAGLFREIGFGASKGGRPPILLTFNSEYGHVVAVDVGPRTVRFALADLQGRVLARHQERTPPPVDTMQHLDRGLRTVTAAGGRDLRRVLGIGIAADLSGARDLSRAESLGEKSGSTVRVDRRANMSAIGEHRQGIARDVDNFAFLSVGDNLTAGIVVNGRLHRGQHGRAGTIGWLRSARGTRAEDLAESVGTVIAHIAAVIDPALVVVGHIDQGHDLSLDTVRKAVAQVIAQPPAVERSALGNDAALTGSLFSALEVADGRLLAS